MFSIEEYMFYVPLEDEFDTAIDIVRYNTWTEEE